MRFQSSLTKFWDRTNDMDSTGASVEDETTREIKRGVLWMIASAAAQILFG